LQHIVVMSLTCHEQTTACCTYGWSVVRWHEEPLGRTGTQVADLAFTQTER
jgi:hypothetical protein